MISDTTALGGYYITLLLLYRKPQYLCSLYWSLPVSSEEGNTVSASFEHDSYQSVIYVSLHGLHQKNDSWGPP